MYALGTACSFKLLQQAYELIGIRLAKKRFYTHFNSHPSFSQQFGNKITLNLEAVLPILRNLWNPT